MTHRWECVPRACDTMWAEHAAPGWEPLLTSGTRARPWPPPDKTWPLRLDSYSPTFGRHFSSCRTLVWDGPSMDLSKHWQRVLAGSRWDVTHHEHRSIARTKRAFAIRIKLHSSHSIHWSLQSCKTLNFKCIKQLF